MAADHLAPSTIRTLVLLAGDCATLAMLAVASAVPLAVYASSGRLRSGGLTRWLGFLWGLAAGLATEGFAAWFTRPPPFQPGLPLQGNPAVFVLFLVLLGGLVAALARLPGGPRARAVVLTLVLAALALRAAGERRELATRGSPPAGGANVLLVTLDTTRADFLGAYGNPTVQSPHFDRLAGQGVLFDAAMAQIPVTGPSHATLLDGTGPWTHGNLLDGIPLPADAVPIAEALRAEGWRAAAFVSTCALDGNLGFARGFEVYDDDFGWLQGWTTTTPGRLAAMVGRHFDPDEVLERRGGRTVDAALGWLDRHVELDRDEPFLLWVHLFDPHGPYQPPPPWDTAYYTGDPYDPAHTSMARVTGVPPYHQRSLDGITDVEWVRAQYAGEISYADEQLGRLVDALDEAGIAGNTLVVVSGDHGEALGEHGQWFDHGDDLYEASSRVPLAVRLPGRIPAGRRVSAPVELTDIAPTIYDILGVDPPTSVTGRSLQPLWNGVADAARPFARALTFDRPHNVAERAAGRIARPTWRLVALRGPDSRFVHHEAEALPDQYFDLARDPTESTHVDPGAELGGLLRDEVRRLLDAAGADSVERSKVELDPRTRSYVE